MYVLGIVGYGQNLEMVARHTQRKKSGIRKANNCLVFLSKFGLGFVEALGSSEGLLIGILW